MTKLYILFFLLFWSIFTSIPNTILAARITLKECERNLGSSKIPKKDRSAGPFYAATEEDARTRWHGQNIQWFQNAYCDDQFDCGDNKKCQAVGFFVPGVDKKGNVFYRTEDLSCVCRDCDQLHDGPNVIPKEQAEEMINRLPNPKEGQEL